MKNLLKCKALAIFLAVAVAVVGIGAGGYIVYGYEGLPEDMDGVHVLRASAVAKEEEPQPVEEEPPVEDEPEEELPQEARELSLTGTSIDKDLKIKLQDQNAQLVTGEIYAVSVQADKKGAKSSDYKDEDKDGIIYIDKMEAGKYTVTLHDLEGYSIKEGTVTVSVKGQIEYKKVDVTAEIKKESQVNTAAEDTAVNNVPVESTLTDTLPLLESTVVTKKVSKKDVDTSNFTKASADSEVSSRTVEKGKNQAPAEPEEPGDSGSPADPKDSEQPQDPDTPRDEDTKTVAEPVLTEASSAAMRLMSSRPVAAAGYKVSDTPTGKASSPDKAVLMSATISVPASIKLYDLDQESSNSYVVALSVSGDDSMIRSIQWTSSDPSVVELSASEGDAVAAVGKANGSAVIKAEVSYDADEEGAIDYAFVECKATVEGMTDDATELKDKSGNTLYVDENAQTKAVLKDYSGQDEFYTAPQYTGWQTIGGKVYYYGEDHKPVTGRQVIGGVEYTFAEDGSLTQNSGIRGIDVSRYQTNIDWNAVAASGIKFAIIRVGYRGSATGVLVEDPYFKRNIAGATKAGIKVGVYFFTQAITEAEAVEEASMAMSLVSGYKLSYPIFIDTESATNGRANGLSRSARTAVVKAFCQTIQNGGYRGGIYASKSWYNDQLKMSSLGGYYIWVAQYSSKCTYSGKYDMWQYSSKGSVPGITGNVDMNISY